MSTNDIEKRKRGRPKKDRTRNDIYSVRLDKDEAYKLEMICFDEERNKGDIIREALDLLFKTRNYR